MSSSHHKFAVLLRVVQALVPVLFLGGIAYIVALPFVGLVRPFDFRIAAM